MPNTLHFIEQVRRKVPHHTNYAVAKALEMDQSQLQKVLCGKSGVGPKAVIRIAELLQHDVRDVLVLIEEDKARTPKDREFWERRSPRITAAIAVAILALTSAVRLSSATADAVHPYSVGFPFYTLCEAVRKFLTFMKQLCLPVFGNVMTRARQPQNRLSLIATADLSTY